MFKMQDISIKDAASQIFQRPLLYVNPSDSMLQVATFLATGPQIYVDGLVVLEENKKLVGRIGGYALANHILNSKEKWLDSNASEILEPLEQPLQRDDYLSKAFRFFIDTKFAFMPVASNAEITASLSLRDLIIYARRIGATVEDLASPLLTIEEDTSVLEALNFMVENGVRNLVFSTKDGPYVVNDRKVLEYMLDSQTRKIVSRDGFEVLDNIRLDSLGAIEGILVNPKVAAGTVAHFFSNITTSCLFVDNHRILTPWDLIIKSSGLMS